MTDEISQLFYTFGQVVVGPIIVGSATVAIMKLVEWYRNKHKHPSIHLTAEKNDKIQELLTEVRTLLGADRAYFSMFHNGTKYVDGSELLKKSRTNESVAAGVTYDAQFYQNVNISLVPEEMMLVVESGPSFTTTESIKDGKFKRMLVSRGIKCIARCAVRKGPDIIGFLGVDWNREVEKPKNIDDLLKYSGIVEQVLSSYR